MEIKQHATKATNGTKKQSIQKLKTILRNMKMDLMQNIVVPADDTKLYN